MRLAGDALAQRLGQARLADARLGRQQHDAAFAGLRLLPSGAAAARFPRRGRPAASRASAAPRTGWRPRFRRAPARPADAPAKPFSACGPRSRNSNKPPICRRVASAMTIVLGSAKRLQPRGKVGRLADDRLLLRGAERRSGRRPRQARWRCRAVLRAGAADRDAPTASTIARPARTACSASSSCACG